jgi:hypothetical protein
MLTSPPPQPSFTADVAPHDTQDPLVASPMRHIKLVAHSLTQKTCIANLNEICPKPAQEDIVNGSVNSMPGLYCDDRATLPTKDSVLDLTNSTLSLSLSLLIVPRIQLSGSFKYFSCISFFFS